MKLARKLREAFEEAKKRDRSFERALHFRAAMLRLEEGLFEALASEKSEEKPCAICEGRVGGNRAYVDGVEVPYNYPSVVSMEGEE